MGCPKELPTFSGEYMGRSRASLTTPEPQGPSRSQQACLLLPDLGEGVSGIGQYNSSLRECFFSFLLSFFK